jgi:hypothetical protein
LLEDRLLTHTGKFQKIVNLQRKVFSGDLYDLDVKYHPNNNMHRRTSVLRSQKKEWIILLEDIECGLKSLFGKPQKKLTKNDYFGMVINNNDVIPEFNLDKKF